MTNLVDGGRLIIAFGQEATEPWSFQRVRRADEAFLTLHDFHAFALNDDSDPFASRYFGLAIKALIGGRVVMLTDSVFDDPRRRRRVRDAFEAALPRLTVDEFRFADGLAERALDTGQVDGILLDDDVYSLGPHGGSNETIAVQSTAPTQLLVTALSAVAARMMTVGEDGREGYDGDSPNEGDEEIYTPNYVSDVRIDEQGSVGFYIDCKAGIEPPMAHRFRQILVEELQAHGVDSAHVTAVTA